MKELIHNDDCIKDEEINRIVKRAKMIVENSNEEILVVYSHKNYFFIGGHVEENESFNNCIVREIKEEAGVEIPFEEREPFFSIKYYCKDYPNIGENTKYITNYYSIKYDLVPNLDNIELTEDEKEGNFKLEYISKYKILDTLIDSLNTCTRVNVVHDTIDALKVYLKKD